MKRYLLYKNKARSPLALGAGDAENRIEIEIEIETVVCNVKLSFSWTLQAVTTDYPSSSYSEITPPVSRVPVQYSSFLSSESSSMTVPCLCLLTTDVFSMTLPYSTS
jgi:hypothetical protein